MNYLFLLWTLLPFQVLAYEDSQFDPASNRRLANLTGLSYYLYSWVGSYYNGTAEFELRHLMDSDGEELCEPLRNRSEKFSADTILGVNKVNPDNKGSNPVEVSLRSNLDLGFVQKIVNAEEYKYLRWQFLSIDQDRSGYSNQPYSPAFDLSLKTGSSGPPYVISGDAGKHDSEMKEIQMNATSCDDPSRNIWWGITFTDLTNEYPKEIHPTTPKVELKFDKESARFSISSWYKMINEGGYSIRGKASIQFRGKVDPLHSDILNEGPEPSWTPTLGFGNNSRNLQFGEKSAGSEDSKGTDKDDNKGSMAALTGRFHSSVLLGLVVSIGLGVAMW